MSVDLETLLVDFREVARLAGIELSPNAITIEHSPAPHKPPKSLPAGKSAVYMFLWGAHCLKVGKAGPKSHARFTSQHYNPASSNSNLSKSLLAAEGQLSLPPVTEATVGDWVRLSTDRAHLLLDSTCPIAVLNLLEAFVQCRLRPHFEGFESQKPHVA